MNARRALSRRKALGALGAAAAAVPPLEARGFGQPAGNVGVGKAPRRLVVFYTPNGTVGPEWRPRGTETSFTFGRILKPLEPLRGKLLVLGGVDMALADSGFGSHHTRGIGGLLTGREILKGTFTSAGPPTAGWASGISLDQHVAKTVGAATRFRSLELGVRVVDAEVRGRISYLGPSQPLPPMDDPYAVFDRLFATAKPAAGGTMGDRLRADRRSVVDFLEGELAAVRRQVGAEDHARLEAHLESVREIERRLTTPTAPVTTAGGAACAPPMVGPRLDVAATENLPAVGKLQMDLLAAALACDLTRVATLQWTHAESNQSFPWLDVRDFHHVLSHAGDGDADAQEKLVKINVWYAEQLRYLLDRLSSYKEGDRTLLDNTVVLWAIEVGKGNTHAHRDLPFLLAGSCGGHFKTGRFVDYRAGRAAGRPHNDLLVSLANAMELPDTTFGDPAHCTGPLPGLG